MIKAVVFVNKKKFNEWICILTDKSISKVSKEEKYDCYKVIPYDFESQIVYYDLKGILLHQISDHWYLVDLPKQILTAKEISEQYLFCITLDGRKLKSFIGVPK